MTEYKPIHFNLFDPTQALFKSQKKEKSEIQVIKCSNAENCDLHKKGQCAFRSILSWQKCPYGLYFREVGFTKRASKFRQWMREKKEEYRDVPYLQAHTEMIAVVGDYILLPYAHMDMCEDVPFLSHGGAFRSGNAFLKREDFTIDNILKLIAFRPQALMGGEITDYQKKSLPLFIRHLSQVMPDIYEEIWNKSDRVKNIAESMTDVGRKARLRSLTPNVGIFKDIHGGEWTWDGKWLICKNRDPSFMLVNKVDEIRIRPQGDPEVVITDNNQVNIETVFLS